MSIAHPLVCLGRSARLVLRVFPCLGRPKNSEACPKHPTRICGGLAGRGETFKFFPLDPRVRPFLGPLLQPIYQHKPQRKGPNRPKEIRVDAKSRPDFLNPGKGFVDKNNFPLGDECAFFFPSSLPMRTEDNRGHLEKKGFQFPGDFNNGTIRAGGGPFRNAFFEGGSRHIRFCRSLGTTTGFPKPDGCPHG